MDSPDSRTNATTLIDTHDALTALLQRQTAILSESRWQSVIAGLPHELSWRIHERLEQLQRERPLTGVSLRARCGGVKTAIIHGIAGNSKWGRSQLRRSNAYKQHRSKHWKQFYAATMQANQRVTSQSHSSHGSTTDD